MSTQTTTGFRKPSRTAIQRGLIDLRDSIRKILDPLLADAAREVVNAVELSQRTSGTLKKSVRTLFVDYRTFSATFFAALDRHVDEAVEELLTGPRKETRAPAVGKPGTKRLSLVDYDQMEESMTVDRVASRILNAADGAFVPLTQRMAVALKLPGLNDRDNPFHPVRFCRALGEAIDRAGFKGEDRQSVVRTFENALLKPLVQTYAELNRQLEERGVEEAPTPPAAFRNTASGAQHTADAARHAARGPDSAGLTGSPAEQLLSALYHRMQLRPGSGAGSAVPAVPPAPVFERVASELQSTAGEATPVPVAPGVPAEFATIDPGLLASINEVQRLNALAVVAARTGSAPDVTTGRDELHLRQRVADKATRQVDKLTIELVGMLFDRIHEDKHIPAEIKTALSRLQFPVMKVALADADLFVSPLQPARRLMDRIASTSVGWLPEGEENGRYLAEVNRAINTVLVAVNEGPSVFEKALDDFEKYLAEERGRDDDPVMRARRALEEAETREVMAVNAAVGVRRAFDGVQIEPYLRDFLLDVWVRVLVSATLKERRQPDFAKRYRHAVSDLIWSVQPKISPDDRQRLVRTIPSVLSVVRDGLQLIDLPRSQCHEFFSRLMASHAHAVKALESEQGYDAPLDRKEIRRKIDELQIVEPAPAQPDEPMEQLDIRAEVVRSAVAANRAEVNVIDMQVDVPPENDGAGPTGRLDDAQIDAMIEAWPRGSWFDLWTGQQTERVRLRWVSPRRNFYLFTSAETGKAHSLAPATLRGYVRVGRISPVEKAPLFERVVDGLMRDLQTEGVAAAA